jgi:hypothetical protein
MSDTLDGEWQRLCEAILQEKDPQKIVELAEQLNRALDKRDAGGRVARIPDNAAGENVSAQSSRDCSEQQKESVSQPPKSA